MSPNKCGHSSAWAVLAETPQSGRRTDLPASTSESAAAIGLGQQAVPQLGRAAFAALRKLDNPARDDLPRRDVAVKPERGADVVQGHRHGANVRRLEGRVLRDELSNHWDPRRQRSILRSFVAGGESDVGLNAYIPMWSSKE